MDTSLMRKGTLSGQASSGADRPGACSARPASPRRRWSRQEAGEHRPLTHVSADHTDHAMGSCEGRLPGRLVAAIAFPYAHPSIINVTLGMRTPEQVERNVELHDEQVPAGLWGDLRTQGLIRSDVLTGHGGGRDERCL
jgi:aryl-alcohol dehydrogenase-like predicted oxidoreductase